MSTFYVYITEQCREEARRHNVLDNVQKLAKKIEKDQSDRGLDHYPPPYRKKVMGRQGRLVIEEYRSDDDIVLCFARYLIRGSYEYGAFYKDTQAYYDRNKVSNEDIEHFLQAQKKKQVKKKPSLNETELFYLQTTNSRHYTDDGAVLESYDWFERMSQGSAKKYLSRYYDLIVKIEDGKLPEGTDTLSHPNNAQIKILFRSFPEYKHTFLIAPIDNNKEGDEEELRKKYSHIMSSDEIEIDELLRHSRRAYPSIITYDENIWISVESSNEANLALSPEEESILESVLTPANTDKPRYPLFINGRPGSGKSTILQYIFADHLARYLEQNTKDKRGEAPLYLTYSTPLLEQARNAVRNILKCGAPNLERGRLASSDDNIEAVLQKSFRNFREFLRSLLPAGIKERFVHANYVDFGRFRGLWEEKRSKHPHKEARAIGAELAWHAIRTFIKGMQHESGGVVDPEYYSIELARSIKSLSDETFKIIYKYVWEGWYKPHCNDNGYWDDQDLARAVLSHAKNELSRYPVVFCDESQDFTTIELELIQQLSVYSKRDLPSHLVKNVPFAFAGDPFQTLNPTGFNWGAMQSSFHENIVQQLDPSGTARLEFNFQELAFNYRSSEHIVKLANLVQLLRAVLLGIKRLRPQHSWTRTSTVSPVFFDKDDAGCKAAVRDQAELVIIVPCQENREIEYVKNAPFLKSMAIREGEITRNILSPARAKGLEYERVLLYGFGDEVISRLPKLLEHISNPEKDPPEIERRLAWEYFLNQFYVAVSRARKRLFIVDSGDALKSFWSFTETNYQKELLKLYDNSDNWRLEELGGMMKGDNSSWSDDRDDPLELARQWQEQGRAQRDPYLLRLAKDNFERADRPEEARLCEAEQYEYEGEFQKAAKLYVQLKQKDSACRCYWADKDTKSVVYLAKQFSDITADPHFISASAINRDKNTAPQIALVLDALEKVTPTPFPDMPGEIDAWRWFFDQFARKTGDAIQASSDHEKKEWRPYVDRLINTIKRFELPLSAYPEIAKLLYLTGNPKRALDYWNKHCTDQKADSKRDKWLIRAQAESESYPSNIHYFHKLEDHKAVIEQWVTNGKTIDGNTPVKLLLDSAISLSDIDAIRVLLPGSDNLAQITKALHCVDHNSIHSLSGALPVAIAHSLESTGDWGQLIGFVSNQSTSDGDLNTIIKHSGINWTKEELIASAVRAMARSERLAKDGAKHQKEVSDFLKKNLIIEKEAKLEKQKSVKSVFKLVDIAEAGAAFERAFRLTYVLEFYEQFFSKNYLSHRVLLPTNDQAKFAKRRWILCKRRLANTQDGRGKVKHEDEAREKERIWRISVDHEPEYPELEPISELDISISEEQSQTSGGVLGKEKEEPLVSSTISKIPVTHQVSIKTTLDLSDHELIAEVLTRKRRIILIDKETEDQVTCGQNNITSDDLNIEDINNSEHSRRWLIRDWKIQCEIISNNDGTVIRFRFADGEAILGFEFFSK